MKIALAYPFPITAAAGEPIDNARDTFRPFVKRFVETYRKFPLGVEHRLVVVCMGGQPLSTDRELFDGVEADFIVNAETPDGIDIGSAQFAARHYDCDFIVGMTSRAYFHREGALRRLVEAREKYGRGLYGASGTYERCPLMPERFPNPHMRTVFYGMDRDDFCRYPYTVASRENAYWFESGKWSYTEWFRDRFLQVKMVLWDQEVDIPDWRNPRLKNIFRRGDQSNMIVFDKHSDLWRDADPKQKRLMSQSAGDK